MKWRKIIAIGLLVALSLSVIVQQLPTVNAAVVGSSGSIPQGGTTGPNGGISSGSPAAAAFRVGIVKETMKPGDELIGNLSNAEVELLLKDHYNNHFPKMENSIIFAPTNNYDANAKLAWYSASSGELNIIDFTNPAEKASKLRLIGTSREDTPVFYAELLRYAPYIDPNNKYDDGAALEGKFGDGSWKNIVNWGGGCSTACAGDSVKVWNWILQDPDEIVNRIKDYTFDDLSDKSPEERYEARLHYLDLLMTLWVISPAGEDREFYADEITRYINKKNIDTKPVLLAVDTVSRFNVPAYSAQKIFIPSIDFVLWAHGATPKSDLREVSFNAGTAINNTKNLIKKSADLAIADLPDRDPITELPPGSGNGFFYGYNGVPGYQFNTRSGYGVWGSRGSIIKGVMEALTFNESGSYYGFIIAGGGPNKNDPFKGDCECEQAVAIKMDGKPAPATFEVKADNVAKQITMTIDMKQTDEVINNWKLFLKNKANLKIQVRLWRSYRSGGDGSSAKWTKVSGPDPATDELPVKEIPIASAAELVKYLNGTNKLAYTDDLMNYPMAPGDKMTLAYNSTITFKWTEAGVPGSKTCESRLQIGGVPGSPEITFFRKPIEPLFGYYTSSPSFWSEIKQGSPSTSGTGSNEAFEAMAGTPTTRNLYFASGGSEFIVDIVTEYKTDGTATRTYTSQFEAVPSGWNMTKTPGSVGHGSDPGAPAAREKCDVSGACYTETVTLSTWKHITQPFVPCSGTPCTGGQPEISHTDYQWTQNGYEKTVGGYSDTWTQTSTFDYMKIKSVRLWKIDKSKVDGMTRLIGTNEVTASVVQGDPTAFYNIAGANTSAEGRLRYSLEPDQHDNVIWNEGLSDNRDANSKSDSYVNEQLKFDQRRALTTTVTAVSDFLILQTSTGDQSVLYFDKVSNSAKTTDPLTVPVTSFDTMWTNNSNSAAKWTPEHIHIGSYNGNYMNPSAKYSGSGGSTVTTIFDSLPAGLSRPSRPASLMRLMNVNVNPIQTIQNGLYETGTSTVFYKNIVIPKQGLMATPYSTAANALYGDSGQMFMSNYSNSHSKVNDIIIHNPVSAERAVVVALPDSMDQRTNASKAVGGNLQLPIKEYEKVLDPAYRQNLLLNGDAEVANSNLTVAGWETWTSTPGANVTFTSRAGDMWVMDGARSFEINTKENVGGAGTNYIGVYYKDVNIKPSVNYKFTGTISCHRCNGYFYIDVYDAAGAVVGTYSSGYVSNTGALTQKTINFTSPAAVSKARIHIVKENSNGSQTGVRDYVFADNLSLQNMSVQEFIAMEPVYGTQKVLNPDYNPYSPAVDETFPYTGGYQSFTAPSDGEYTFEVWGAEGYNNGGRGGYSKGNVTLSTGEKVYIYVGQAGQSEAAAWNGGGSSYSSSLNDNGGGGGGTDIRLVVDDLYSRIIVAGGGGGGRGAGGAGGGTNGGGAGASQSSGGAGYAGGTSTGSFGLGGWYSQSDDDPGGGGGWYGGGIIRDNAAGGGSGYVYTSTSYKPPGYNPAVQYQMTSSSTIEGTSSMPAPSGGTQIGQSSHGFARITKPQSGNGGGQTLNYSYTGAAQSYTAPVTGAYTIEVWGAEGGHGYQSTSSYGGKGGYSKADINLTVGDTLSLRVGGKGQDSWINGAAGYNGGGTGNGPPYGGGGGGASDVRRNGSALSDRIIVAGGGGGGGAEYGNELGGGGGGANQNGLDGATNNYGRGGTLSAGGTSPWGGNGSLGQGGDGSGQAGGGGGGYYGGGGSGNSPDGGAGGGSGYAAGSSIVGYNGAQSMPAPSGGNETGHAGNGFIKIIEPAAPPQPQYIDMEVMVIPGDTAPPESAYILVEREIDPTGPVVIPGVGTFTPGKFISLDYEFQVRFPNVGDFYGNGALGISSPTLTRGKGFVDNMDTTEWTQSKSVRFPFNVIFNDQVYGAGEWIDLPVNQSEFNFYCPLGNREAISALVEFRAIANNGLSLDNDLQTNKVRDGAFQAKHSAYKGYNIDVVGRIGNMVIEDTGDFRFSNLFKQSVTPEKWYVPNIVRLVNSESQRAIVGDRVDIRAKIAASSTNYLDTYGLLPHLRQEPVTFPLSPEKNNIQALRKQPMRLGYKVLTDIQTIGNYYNNMQIIPYYYTLNLQNGSITPVDVYMKVDSIYKPINKHGAAVPEWDPTSIHPYILNIDWTNESGRRNYSGQEAATTDAVIDFYKSADDADPASSMLQPLGTQYPFGTAQIMYLTGRNRTFIGSVNTNGNNWNPGGKIPNHLFQLQAQRWHFTYGVPSSTVVVEKDKDLTQSNINALRNNYTVLLMAADIKALGDTYALQYKAPGGNGTVNINGTTWPISDIPYPVLNVYSVSKSSADDLQVSGTH